VTADCLGNVPLQQHPFFDAGLADHVLGIALRGLADRVSLKQRGELLAGDLS
jgi:hypothetical protein